MSPPNEEADLISRIAAGDQQAMADFALRYRPVVIASIRKQGIAEQDWADLVQEILSAAFSQIQRRVFRGDCSLGTWLTTIARGRAIDKARSPAGRAQKLTHSIEGTASFNGRPELTVPGTQETTLAVRQTLGLLNPKERTVLKLKEMDGYSVKEITTISGIPKKQVYRLLETARENFRRLISARTPSRSRLIE
jgi:RNA polymerase sigma-70 factor (ECF subfamily)